ncbi:MAG: UbiD family decarboxylase [Deltaproteobacteria bacterium]|nr:UbiD family decarboxylase [Deltaproteobacteria bacterium]
MSKDLRTWLQDLGDRIPGEPLRVSKAVRPSSFEVASILHQLEGEGNLSAVLFEKVTSVKGEPTDFRLLSHTFTTREKLAVSLGSKDTSRVALFEKFLDLGRQKRKVQVIPLAEAPVKEMVVGEESLDLADLPIMRHNFHDGGPYLTPVVVACAPGKERPNTSWNRMMYVDSHHLAIYMSPRHLWMYFQEAEAADKPLPVAVVLGHHIGFMLSASALVPLDEDEYEVAGGILGEPLRVVPSEVYGPELLVPADAEAVIEGEIVSQRRSIEGPFGEFTGYIGPQRLSWLFRARAITRRPDPIVHCAFAAHLDHLYAHFPIEASIFQRVKQAVAGVKDLTWLDSGGPFHLVISLKKRTEGEPMRAALAALSASNFIKHVIVVDEDVDPANAREVMWAIANCVQADSRITLLNNLQGHLMDPSLRQEIKGAGLVIDATRPVDRPYPPKAGLPPEILKKFPLNDYLRP